MDQQHLSTFVILCFGFIAMIVFIGLLIVPYWQIFKKAGFPGPLALLMFVPMANIVVLYVVAFSEWKVVPVAQAYPASLPPSYPPPPPPAFPPQG